MIILDFLFISFLMASSLSATILAMLYAIRWYDLSQSRFTPDRPWVDAMVERGMRPFVTYVKELFLSIAYAAILLVGLTLRLAGRGSHLPPSDSSAKGEPLVTLVHGLMGTGANMWVLKWRLARHGVKNLAVFDYQSTKGTIDDNRDLLRDFIVKAMERTGAEGVVLIAHSMGGLIAHDYACEYGDQRGGVRGLIALGSPFRGTRMAALGLTKSAMSLHPSNPLFARSTNRKPAGVFVSIGSVFDQLVVPFQNASHPKEDGFELVDSCGHAGLIFLKEPFSRVTSWLEKAMPGKSTTGAS